jgi:hypothetical protein
MKSQATAQNRTQMRKSFGGISEQSKAISHRLTDALALQAAARWRGAMYLAGYSVECQLKVKLMRIHDCRNLREHQEELLRRGMIKAKHDLIWSELIQGLAPDEWGKLSLSVGCSPKELKAL